MPAARPHRRLLCLWMMFASLAVVVSACRLAMAQAPALELRAGDHVTTIGNTLADRMQHDGWLEALIQSRFPDRHLVFRNISFPGDEINKRPRSESFGTPDEWLTKVKSDVIFAFFGYNESFAGEAGVESFRKELAKFIDQTLAQKYNGQSAPRLVLFSPIAHENLHNPNLPDGSENNARLALYTKAMAEVAKERKIVFVDLFTPTGEIYKTVGEPLTINGVHLTPEGNKRLAQIIDEALFGPARSHDVSPLEKLRQAVIDKDFHWFSRYRTVDAYNVFGGRSKLAWGGQSNADVMSREMEIFDAMTENRDKRVWAVAAGGDLAVDDKNTPAEVPVKTNKPGPLPDGTFPFLGGQEAIGKMKVASGMQINLFASEEQFPDLIKPVQMAVDTDGRLWAATWPSYPHWNPKQPLQDKLVILPDEDHDGKADRLIVFADGLNSVTGFEFWGGGVLVAAAPELWSLKDTDGDDKADVKIRMLQGISAEDTHHTANALVIGPDGGLYFSRGVFHVDNMETPTKTFRSLSSGVYRFDPRTFEIDFHFPIGPNPHGDVFDQWGYQFASDGTSGTGSYVSIGKGVGAPKQWYEKRVRPVPATGILSSSHFPEKNQGNFLICNAIGFLGVLQHEVKYRGADIHAEEIEPIVVSDDGNFRPSDLEIGGDGALYIADWQNPLIGHMQHNIRDPNRDHLHGRIYRVTATGRPLLKPAKMKGKPIDEVLENFYAKENNVRYRARLELSGRETPAVMAAVNRWTATREPDSTANEQALLEALWVCEEHRVPNEALLAKVLRGKEPRVRAAAIRTLGHWGPKVAAWEPMLTAAARDAEPLIRAEAAKAAVSFDGLAAAEVVFEVASRPTDVQLDFVLNYARGKIKVDNLVKESLKSGKALSEAARAYALRNADPNDLLKMEQSEAVYDAILSRSNASGDALKQALAGLAKTRKVRPIEVLLKLIDERDAANEDEAVATLTKLLIEQPAKQLRDSRARLVKLAAEGHGAATRQLGYAAWIMADGSSDAAFDKAIQSVAGLKSLLGAIGTVPSADLRGGMFPRVESLLFETPPQLVGKQISDSTGSGIKVDYFATVPANAAIETYAKLTPQASGIVPEISLNVPQRPGGEKFALRFSGPLLIETAGKYTFFIGSDDGSRLYLDGKQVVNNDGHHTMAEKKGTIELAAGPHPLVLTYFNSGGGSGLSVSYSGPGIKKHPLPAKKFLAPVGDTVSDAAIAALTAIPGYEGEKFVDLARLINSGRNRASAVHAMRQIPKQHWRAEEIRPLVDNLVALVSSVPGALRTGPLALDAIALAKNLSGALPPEQATAALEQLENLDVQIIAIGTVPHRMLFDKERIVIEAGRPVEFRFANTDAMPHNFSIVKPGSMEEIGLEAEATSRDPKAVERHYIPKSPNVLLASRLLQPGQSQAISFEAPKQAGIYPYVCTYPGHWRRMYGALYVVDDVDRYQADPAVYLAEHKLAVKDDLLKLIGQSHEWKFEELWDTVKTLENGRSFEVGQNAFKVASCVGCHKIGEQGQQFGPELTKLDPNKHTLEHLLRSMVTPSDKIDEKFQSYVFQLDSGKVVSGMIVEETPSALKVIENPLAKAQPLLIEKSTIEERQKSPKSIMPEGLLNRLTHEEILDLVAYVYARGDKKNALFQGHHHEH